LEARTPLAADGTLLGDAMEILGDPCEPGARADVAAASAPWQAYGPQPAAFGSPDAFGAQSVLFIRARFLDRGFNPVDDYSDAALRSQLASINDYFLGNSFGQVSYPDSLFEIVPDTVTIPRTVAQLNQSADINGVIHSQARNQASSLGYNLAEYDSIVVLFPDMSDGGKINYGGLATIGGQEVWLHDTISTSIWGHELGHNLGAGHSGFWEPNDSFEPVGSPGAGQNYTYGNQLDLMGSGNLAAGDFSAYWKLQLGWFSDATQTVEVPANGTFVLYALDEGATSPDRIYALQVPRLDSQEYWLEHRAGSGTSGIDHGLVFNWVANTQGSEPALIDLTPESLLGGYREDRLDAALPIGRTFSDWPASLHITPIARNATPGSDSVEVVIQRGDFPDNVPPRATLSADTSAVDVGQTIQFSATAESGDNDANILFWDFGDGTTMSGSLTPEHQWTAAGEYPVRFSVSDTKGGLAERIMIVRVGPRDATLVHRTNLDTTVNTTTSGDQENPAAASNGDDRFVVVWESGSQDGSGKGIYAQRFLADGTRVGGPLLVNTTVSGDRKNPDVAMAANGDFLVVWQGRGNADENQDEIYAQRFNWAGEKIGGEFRVNTFTFANQENPAVAVAPSGGEFVIAWSSGVLNRHVNFRRYAADGTPRDALEQSAPGGRHFSGVDVAMHTDGGFVLVWDNDSGEEGGSDTSGLGVYGQVYDADGVAATGVLSVNTTTANDQQRPRVAIDAEGDFTVVWESIEQDGDGSGVFLRSFGRDGTALSGEVQANETTSTDQTAPALAVDARGRRIVTWRDGLENQISPTDGNNAYRTFDVVGTPLSPESRVLGVQTDFFAGPDVAALETPRGMVIVNPEHESADGVDVRARFYALAEPLDVRADEVVAAPAGTVDVDAAANDSSPNGGPLVLSLHRPPSAGAVEILDGGTPDDPADDRIRYTPAAAFRGTDSFTYRVTDAVGATALGVITVQIGSPWHNPILAQDVDDNGAVEPLDVLTLINEINENGIRTLTVPTLEDSPPPYWDVDGDGQIAPNDVLDVINYLNDQSRLSLRRLAESEAIPDPLGLALPDGSTLPLDHLFATLERRR